VNDARAGPAGATTVVIGAGPAGIGAALALGHDAIVVEQGDGPGGLAATLEMEGAIFDLGGHSFHTPHPAVRKLVFDALPMQEQVRQAWCHVAGDWVRYPFQKHFASHRDAALVEQCRAGLAAPRTPAVAANFAEHIEQRFGAGIARHFLVPYNEKLWGPDLGRLAADWTAERVAAPAGSNEHFLASGQKRTPLQAETTVAYPAEGGFGEIFRALAKRLTDMRYRQRVLRIDPAARRIELADGTALPWQRIVSTLPLPVLVDLLPGAPATLRDAMQRLVALPISLVLLALDTRLDTPVQRVYCPGDGIAGHKVVLNHNSSDFLRALPRHGIEVEVSGAGAAAHDGDDKLIANTIEGLIAIGLLASRERVTRARVVRLALGYPVPTHDRAAIVDEARRWLAERAIATVGRFGEWAYINSDEALARGFEAGKACAAIS
jgi:UDP-galactopyranose mutase